LVIETTQQEIKNVETDTASKNSQEETTEETAEAQAGIRLAYDEYLSARKRLADAFRGRECQDREAYVSAAWRYRVYEEAMQKAEKAREKSERQALNIYLKTVDKALGRASEDLRERMIEALRECRRKTEEAWQSSIEISTDMTYVFQNDVNIQETESRPWIHKKINTGGKSIRKIVRTWMKGLSVLLRRDTKTSVP